MHTLQKRIEADENLVRFLLCAALLYLTRQSNLPIHGQSSLVDETSRMLDSPSYETYQLCQSSL